MMSERGYRALVRPVRIEGLGQHDLGSPGLNSPGLRGGPARQPTLSLEIDVVYVY
ncbi:hypothetical protein Pr1d_29440 [Bythopirellula goksoeyrii]|uniref:Uncharacterized protein n=1 Tax=Bythopirellula goksoeyrii TaxID=1400387 RepID=A0A5B9QDR2_9BACT|nr:hypothetical protein Pr1d_29440 [Bythopirellula goksoeyrii]